MKKIQKWLAGLVAGLTLCTSVSWAAPASNVQLQVDGVSVAVPAYINQDSRTMVATSIAEPFGMTCRVDGEQILFTRNGATKCFQLGSRELGNLQMDTQPVLENGQVYVPVAFLAEAFGFETLWDGASCRVMISTGRDHAINVAGVPAPSYDYSQANQLPMTGYFEKELTVTLPDGTQCERTVKFYISEDAGIRPYFTLITVPSGVDTTQFLQDSGWFDVADENRECLFIMEPDQSGQWGTLENESAYVNAAINYYKAPAADKPSLDTGKNTNYFSSYGMNYFVGYGAGAPALEAWAANNPGSMISQVYLDSPGLEQHEFDVAAAKFYDGDEASNNVALTIDPAQRIYYNELPIPTWFINCDNPVSLDYWKGCSDCVTAATSDRDLGLVYQQSRNSDAWQTEFFGPISKVAVLQDSQFNAVENTRNIYDFLTAYTRYDNTCAFASQLAFRVRAHELEESGLLTRHTTMVEGEAREYLIYVPANCSQKYPDGSPVIFVWAGNTQSDLLFMDATSWRTVADEEGFICVFPSEQYNASSSVTVSHKNTQAFYLNLREELKASSLNIDWSRIYCTGQSAGSSATNAFASAYPEYYAAYASTSGPTVATDSVGAGTSGIPVTPSLSGAIAPNYLLVGEGDMPTRTGSLFDDDANQLDMWAEYFLSVNQTGGVNDYISCETTGLHNRFTTYTWNNGQGLPLTKLTMTALRNHNCMVHEMPMMWEYLSHFSAEWNETTGEIIRYYSASSFAKQDAVEIK